MANSPREVAVLGCGRFLGLTLGDPRPAGRGPRSPSTPGTCFPQARSSRATGSWTPDSRIALKDAAGPAFGALWEQMARISFKTYRQYLGLPGDPIVWRDRYRLSDISPQALRGPNTAPRPGQPGQLDFADYSDRIADLTPRYESLPPGLSRPFPRPMCVAARK